MKLFKKLMAGAMAIAMLSAYTVAFAGSVITGGVVSSGAATVTGSGKYAGESEPVFTMLLPTAANVGSAISFTVDPEQIIENSPPANSIDSGAGKSTFGTVIFSTVSGTGSQNTTYSNKSAPLRVTSLSSVDVTVNMLATLSDTKMKLSTTSGFTSTSKEHLYLGIEVATVSGGTSTTQSTECIDGLGATDATVLKAVPGNFKTTVSGGVVTTTTSGGIKNDDTSWNSVEYSVVGYSNNKNDAIWQADGLNAPDLTIKWVVDPANKLTYSSDDFLAGGTATTYTAKFDKAAYTKDEKITLYVKPASETAALRSAKCTYISLNAAGKMDRSNVIMGTVNATPVNGVYSVTFTCPDPATMAKTGATPGTTVTQFTKPTFELTVS